MHAEYYVHVHVAYKIIFFYSFAYSSWYVYLALLVRPYMHMYNCKTRFKINQEKYQNINIKKRKKQTINICTLKT